MSTRVMWGIAIALQLIVLATMTAKRQFRDFPTLYGYILVSLCQSPLGYLVYSHFGYQSWTAYRVAWISQGVVVLARWICVCQLCYIILRQFRGIWGVTWRVLVFLSTVALMLAIWLGGHDFVRLISTFDMGIELSIATVLAVFFAFARYYQVQVLPSLRSMGIAFCLYSCFRALNDAVLQKLLYEYSNTWNLFDELTYVATLTLIVSAVYLLNRVPPRSVRLLPAGIYAAYMPEANARLSALNDRLGEMLKAKVPSKQ